ncbi:hypothetical protein FQN53_007277 [Emmonsiellopsis sp. PD_33]|nr:hypothetical protein FQN53_007277 [Emmonsiellopsis sp. PD_33]
MRATLRLLANVKPARYLEPNTPTGLTGLLTHPQPRQALLGVYSDTLSKLKDIPESSVYRQATEALTQHRLKIVESTLPPGYEKWLKETQELAAQNPDRYQAFKTPNGSILFRIVEKGQSKITQQDIDERQRFLEQEQAEDAADAAEEMSPEQLKLYNEKARKEAAIAKEQARQEGEASEPEIKISWVDEPVLEASQISEIENKIGAGLIEEVIQVAHGELELVDEMAKSRAWEELEEKPKPGQWTYFGRGANES